MNKLSICGSAGRRNDADFITAQLFSGIVKQSQLFLEYLHFKKKVTITEIITGGAAVCDHSGVFLFINKIVPKLTLHLPAEWDHQLCRFQEITQSCPGSIANYYHKQFQKKTKIPSFDDIAAAIEMGAVVEVTPGFKERNVRIAKEGELLLAMTFGEKHKLKESGGSTHCFENFSAFHGLDNIYHMNLPECKIYKVKK